MFLVPGFGWTCRCSGFPPTEPRLVSWTRSCSVVLVWLVRHVSHIDAFQLSCSAKVADGRLDTSLGSYRLVLCQVLTPCQILSARFGRVMGLSLLSAAMRWGSALAGKQYGSPATHLRFPPIAVARIAVAPKPDSQINWQAPRGTLRNYC